jgi:MarR family transcriptional regulator for hemolysin
VCRFGKLAELTSIEPPTLSRLLNVMQQDRLIRRRRVPTDSRSVDVSLTPLGIRKVEETMPFAMTVNDGFLNGINKADVSTTRRVLVQIYENVLKMESRRASAR